MNGTTFESGCFAGRVAAVQNYAKSRSIPPGSDAKSRHGRGKYVNAVQLLSDEGRAPVNEEGI